MGSDLYYMARDNALSESERWRRFRSALCSILGLRVKHDVSGPGDHRGATDEEIIQAVHRAVKGEPDPEFVIQWCPACVVGKVETIEDRVLGFRTRCKWCGMSGPQRASRREAIRAWNRVSFVLQDGGEG